MCPNQADSLFHKVCFFDFPPSAKETEHAVTADFLHPVELKKTLKKNAVRRKSKVL